ncbi:MAG: hypothetical protein ACJ76H_08165 [Bacteriovoracaceae bacterium]
MKKILPIVAATFLLVACDEMKGQLSVNEELTVQAKKTGLFQSGTKEAKIPAASYEAKLNPTSKTSINLELKVNGKDIKVPFKFKEGTTIPQYDGQLDILSADSGQPYDLHADVKSETNSYDFDTTETCVAGYVPVRRCVTHPAESHCETTPARHECHTNRQGTEECRDIPETRNCVTRPSYTDCQMISEPVYGSQRVTKRNTTTRRYVVVDVLAAGKDVAQFNHSDSNTYTSTVSADMCVR